MDKPLGRNEEIVVIDSFLQKYTHTYQHSTGGQIGLFSHTHTHTVFVIVVMGAVHSSSFLQNKYSSYKSHSCSDSLVANLIKEKKLAPFYKPSEEDSTIECPICFLHFPQDSNYTTCCIQNICTDCFTQIKVIVEQQDNENSTPSLPISPVSSSLLSTCFDETSPHVHDKYVVFSTCPFCVSNNFSVIYVGPSSAYLSVLPSASSSDNSHSSTHHPPPAFLTKRPDLKHFAKTAIKPYDIHTEWKQKIRKMAQKKPGPTPSYLGPILSDPPPSLRSSAHRRLPGRHQQHNTTLSHLTQSSDERGRVLSQAAHLTANALEHRNTQVLNTMRILGADLEELMLMEAIRQSLTDTAPTTLSNHSSEQPTSTSSHALLDCSDVANGIGELASKGNLTTSPSSTTVQEITQEIESLNVS